jgi:hypothetical protein
MVGGGLRHKPNVVTLTDKEPRDKIPISIGAINAFQIQINFSRGGFVYGAVCKRMFRIR